MSVRKKSISSRKALVIHYAFITFYFNWSNELIRYRMKRRNIHLDHMYSEKSLLFSISTLLFDMVFNRYFSSKGFIIIANILPVILFSFSCCKLYHNYQSALWFYQIWYIKTFIVLSLQRSSFILEDILLHQI